VTDALDRAIVLATQAGLPLVPDPWGSVAARIGISREALLERVRAMLADGRIRRIGAVPNHYRLGWMANGMLVCDVEDTELDRLGPAVGALEFVSHCYRRPRRPGWPYNLYCMLHGRTHSEAEAKAARVRELLGSACRGSEILYSRRILKKTGLRFAG